MQFSVVCLLEFHRISHVKTAQEAWKFLETSYEGTKKVKDTKFQILTRFEEMKMSEDKSFDSFYGRSMRLLVPSFISERRQRTPKL